MRQVYINDYDNGGDERPPAGRRLIRHEAPLPESAEGKKAVQKEPGNEGHTWPRLTPRCHLEAAEDVAWTVFLPANMTQARTHTHTPARTP